MEIDQLRYSPLWRYHDAACEVAISLLAFSRMDIASHEDPAIGLRARIMVKIMTDMHHFAFNARKAIELAGVYDGQVIQLAKDLVPASLSPDTVHTDCDASIDICKKPLWWVISRIIHSQQVHAVDVVTEGEASETRVFSTSRFSHFGFKSDLDGVQPGVWDGSSLHYVPIEGLVDCYLSTLGPRIEQRLTKLLE